MLMWGPGGDTCQFTISRGSLSQMQLIVFPCADGSEDAETVLSRSKLLPWVDAWEGGLFCVWYSDYGGKPPPTTGLYRGLCCGCCCGCCCGGSDCGCGCSCSYSCPCPLTPPWRWMNPLCVSDGWLYATSSPAPPPPPPAPGSAAAAAAAAPPARRCRRVALSSWQYAMANALAHWAQNPHDPLTCLNSSDIFREIVSRSTCSTCSGHRPAMAPGQRARCGGPQLK